MTQIPSFLPVKKNFRIWRGTDFVYPFQLLIRQNGITASQNVTGYQGVFQIEDPDTNTVLLTITNNNGIAFAADGMITISIPSSTTSTFTWNQGKYEFLVTDSGSPPRTDSLLTGRISVFGL